MLSPVEQAFVGRDEIRTPLKMPAWEATLQATGAKIITTLHVVIYVSAKYSRTFI